MSTYNICFRGEIRKYIYIFLKDKAPSGPLGCYVYWSARTFSELCTMPLFLTIWKSSHVYCQWKPKVFANQCVCLPCTDIYCWHMGYCFRYLTDCLLCINHEELVSCFTVDLDCFALKNMLLHVYKYNAWFLILLFWVVILVAYCKVFQPNLKDAI